jgi:hypothetical protein
MPPTLAPSSHNAEISKAILVQQLTSNLIYSRRNSNSSKPRWKPRCALEQHHFTTIWPQTRPGGVRNLHHPMWDHKERPHQDIGANALIKLIEDHDLQLLTPEGAITFDNRAGSTGVQTTLDLTWATPDITDQLVSCVVQDNWRFVADHTPVATRFNLSPQAIPKVKCWQW